MCFHATPTTATIVRIMSTISKTLQIVYLTLSNSLFVGSRKLIHSTTDSPITS